MDDKVPTMDVGSPTKVHFEEIPSMPESDVPRDGTFSPNVSPPKPSMDPHLDMKPMKVVHQSEMMASE